MRFREPETHDYESWAMNHLATQYQESPKIRAYIRALMRPLQLLEKTFFMQAQQTSLEETQGAQLDILGSIVGFSRYLRHRAVVHYFGFEDTPLARGFGQEGVLGYGGYFFDEGASLKEIISLPDTLYRKFLKACIIKNSMQGTCEELIAMMRCLFPEDVPIMLDDLGAMAVYLSVPVKLPDNLLALLRSADVMPHITGVKISYGVHFDPIHTFGFQDQSYAKAFGEEGKPQEGAPFSEQI